MFGRLAETPEENPFDLQDLGALECTGGIEIKQPRRGRLTRTQRLKRKEWPAEGPKRPGPKYERSLSETRPGPATESPSGSGWCMGAANWGDMLLPP